MQYFLVFRSYVGHKLYLYAGLSCVSSLLDGLGIVMLLPLAAETQYISAETNWMSRILNTTLEFFGVSVTITAILVVIFVIFCIKGMLRFIELTFKEYLLADLIGTLRNTAVDRYSKMSYRYFLNKNTGFLTNVLTVEINRLSSAFSRFGTLLSEIIYIFAFLLLSFSLNWMFTALAMVGGLSVLLLLRFASRFSRKSSILLSSEMGSFQGLLIQTVQSFKYLISTAKFGSMGQRLKKSISILSRLQFRIGTAKALVKSAPEPVIVFFVVAIIYYHSVVLGQNIALVAVSILLFYRILKTVMGFQKTWQDFNGAIGSVDIVSKTLNEIQQSTEPCGTKKFDSFKKEIKLDHVCFSYDNGTTLDDINVCFKKNTSVALVGESGVGKSTVVDLVTGVIKPDRGEVTIDGCSLTEIDINEYRKQLGYVTQESILYDDTISNNISLWNNIESLRGALSAKVVAASKRAFCEEFILSQKYGYNTEIGDRGVLLSGGERQRLAIAREFFKEPSILIFDEATSSLDTQSEKYIQESIAKLKGQVTVIMIAHRLSTVKSCDYIYVLENGRIVEEGPPDTLIEEKDSFFRKMCKLQNIA